MRKIIIAITGGTVLLVGIAMIVLPGPAIVVIPAGLAILATEFIWARRALRKSKAYVRAKFKGKSAKPAPPPETPAAQPPA